MTIGARIKEKRIELNMSQRDLAEKMNYSNHSTIGKIERGQVDISQTRMAQFAEVLHTDVAYLMGWDDDKQENPAKYDGISDKRQALIDFAKSVPEDKAELVLRVMKSILGDS